MATLNGNNAYLSWNGTDVSGWWTDAIDKNASVATEDITAGAGATHIMRAPKLKDNSMSFALVYDATDWATYKASLVAGTTATLIYGPESNTAGKPKFECSMILTTVRGPNLAIDKSKVMVELDFEAADAPTATLEADTF